MKNTERCSKCKQWKPLDQFGKDKRNIGRQGCQGMCRECTREYQRQWSEANRDHRRKQNREWEKANREHRREYDRKRYHANRESKREHCRKWYQANRKSRIEYARKWRKRHPNYKRDRYPMQYKAKNALHQAIRQGKLKKPNVCSKCGRRVDKRALHGHHENYKNPLDVVWLCQRCHTEIHRRKRKSNEQ